MKRLIVVIVFIATFAAPSRARADVAPPLFPPGSNVQPGDEGTAVRMQAETVLIDVKDDRAAESLGSAVVTADFTMRNLGSQDESMAVRFPISSNDGRFQYPRISGLSVKVDGKAVSTREAVYPDVRYGDDDVPWAEFDLSFPVDKDVQIEVRYNLQGSGYFPYTAYYYVLETGAGWFDTIGSADITLRLPYAASAQNIVQDMQIGWAETTPDGVISGNEIKWHFEDFEPGPEGEVHNMEFGLVAPSAWHAIEVERANVAKNPDDGEAWGRLGKAYKSVFFMSKAYRTDAGGAQLYDLSVEAYERCLSLLPKDAQWHAGFADLLASHAYWDFGGPRPASEAYRALEEIRTALQLAPQDAKVREIAEVISGMFPEAMPAGESDYVFIWLTQSPTPFDYVIQTPTETASAATSTPAPASPTTPTPGGASPACASLGLIPLAITVIALRKRRQ